MVAAAIVGGAVIGAGASMAASNQQKGAANRATALQGSMFERTQANLQPYMGTGAQANARLADLLGTSGNTSAAGYGSLSHPFTMQDYLANQDPGYQFQLQQGQQALQSSQAAQSGVLSGAALKDLVSFNQGMAATGYQNAWNRWMAQNTNTYNRLSGMAGLGENAAAGVGNMGVQTGANMANTITGAGNAQAAGYVGAANSINNAVGYYSVFGKPGSDPYVPSDGSVSSGLASGITKIPD